MSVSDPIADMFTRIRNAILIKNEEVFVPFSQIKAEVARILREDGYIKYFEIIEESGRKKIKLGLRYDGNGYCVISELRRVSKPGNRVYVKKRNVPKVLSGIGLSIVSTCKGMLSGRSARLNNVGGELIGIIS